MAKTSKVVTQNEIISNKETLEAIKEAREVGHSPIEKLKVVYQFDNAPMGRAFLSLRIKGEYRNIEIFNKQIDITDSEEFEEMKLALLQAGFHDVSKRSKQIEKPIEKPKEKDYEYTLLHPEQSQDNDINGTISFNYLGKEHAIQFKHGKIITKAKELYTFLLNHSWIQLSKKEIGGKDA